MKVESFTAPNPGPYTLDGTRSYVLDGTAIIDPGPPIDSHLDALAAAAPRLSAIFITHRHEDHAPGAELLRARTGAPVIGPAGIDPAPDIELHDGSSWPIGDGRLEAIATPGHTAEHFCFLTDDGQLFTGDTILGSGTTTIFPPDGDMGAYLESLQRLRDRKPRLLRPGHGPDRADADAWIGYYIEHRTARERQILAVLSARDATIQELRGRVYPDLDPRLERAAELQLQAHLTKLERENRVAQSGGRWGI